MCNQGTRRMFAGYLLLVPSWVNCKWGRRPFPCWVTVCRVGVGGILIESWPGQEMIEALHRRARGSSMGGEETSFQISKKRINSREEENYVAENKIPPYIKVKHWHWQAQNGEKHIQQLIAAKFWGVRFWCWASFYFSIFPSAHMCTNRNMSDWLNLFLCRKMLAACARFLPNCIVDICIASFAKKMSTTNL